MDPVGKRMQTNIAGHCEQNKKWCIAGSWISHTKMWILLQDSGCSQIQEPKVILRGNTSGFRTRSVNFGSLSPIDWVYAAHKIYLKSTCNLMVTKYSRVSSTQFNLVDDNLFTRLRTNWRFPALSRTKAAAKSLFVVYIEIIVYAFP